MPCVQGRTVSPGGTGTYRAVSTTMPTYHITRDPSREPDSPHQPDTVICGELPIALDGSWYTSTLRTYYTYKHLDDWCPACQAGLTPLDALAGLDL